MQMARRCKAVREPLRQGIGRHRSQAVKAGSPSRGLALGRGQQRRCSGQKRSAAQRFHQSVILSPSLSCISHHPTAEGGGKGRVSCLVIRENHGRRTGSLQKKCLTAGEPEKPCCMTRGVKKTIGKYACERPFPPPGPRLSLTALSHTSARRVMRKAGQKSVRASSQAPTAGYLS